MSTNQKASRGSRSEGAWVIIRSRGIGIVLILMSLLTTISAYVSTREQRQVTECQTRFNLAYSQALNERSLITTSDRQANVDLITSIGSSGNDPKLVQAALQMYLVTVDANNKQRAETPLPTNPSCERDNFSDSR